MHFNPINVNDNWLGINSNYEQDAKDPPIKDNRKINFSTSNDPEFMLTNDKDHAYPFNLSTLDSEYYAIDTCNSNCIYPKPIPPFKNLSDINNFNNESNTKCLESNPEKKFVSELHINIKDPYFTETKPKYEHFNTANDNNNVIGNFNKLTQNSGIHCSSFETYIGNNPTLYYHKEESMEPSSGGTSASSDSDVNPVKEFHSEKFIYLGCTGNLDSTAKMEEINLYNQQIHCDGPDDNEDYQSNTGDNMSVKSEDESSRTESDPSKVFTSKSVQTSKKIDCIFKTLCDRSVETDANGVESQQRELTFQCKPIRKNSSDFYNRMNKNIKCESSQSEHQDSFHEEHIYQNNKNHSEHRLHQEQISNQSLCNKDIKVKMKNIKCNSREKSLQNISNQIPHHHKHTKILKSHTNKNNEIQNKSKSSNDSNQDTYPTSYTNSFSTSNEVVKVSIKEKHHDRLHKKSEHVEPLNGPDYKPNKKTTLNHVHKNKSENIKTTKSNMETKIIGDKLGGRKSRCKLQNNIAKFDRRDLGKLSGDYSIKSKPGLTNSSNGGRDESDRNSYEIQYLLDNLNTHLQNTVKSHSKVSKPTNSNILKPMATNVNNGVYSASSASFWDNPLTYDGQKSLNGVAANFFHNRQGQPNSAEIRNNIERQKSVNPEIQAIFDTLEKGHIIHNHHNQQERLIDNSNKSNRGARKSSDRSLNKFQNMSLAGDSISMKSGLNNNLNMGSRNDGSINNGGISNSNRAMNNPSNYNSGCGDISFNQHENASLDPRFPPNLKYQRCFDLSPYDELVKSHLNSSDRRIKSVAAKNGCRIAIDGPISLIDPTSTCQAIRNKVSYRCIVAGSSKERMDKCLNYLKETFPNTCLRLHARNGMNPK